MKLAATISLITVVSFAINAAYADPQRKHARDPQRITTASLLDSILSTAGEGKGVKEMADRTGRSGATTEKKSRRVVANRRISHPPDALREFIAEIAREAGKVIEGAGGLHAWPPSASNSNRSFSEMSQFTMDYDRNGLTGSLIVSSFPIDGTSAWISVVWYEHDKSEQAGARQPATAPDSKSEGGEKAKPDSAERPQ